MLDRHWLLVHSLCRVQSPFLLLGSNVLPGSIPFFVANSARGLGSDPSHKGSQNMDLGYISPLSGWFNHI